MLINPWYTTFCAGITKHKQEHWCNHYLITRPEDNWYNNIIINNIDNDDNNNNEYDDDNDNANNDYGSDDNNNENKTKKLFVQKAKWVLLALTLCGLTLETRRWKTPVFLEDKLSLKNLFAWSGNYLFLTRTIWSRSRWLHSSREFREFTYRVSWGSAGPARNGR